jgi:hypothetical protein
MCLLSLSRAKLGGGIVTHAEGLLPPRGRHAEVSTPLYSCCPQGDEYLPGGDHGGLDVVPQMSKESQGGGVRDKVGGSGKGR